MLNRLRAANIKRDKEWNPDGEVDLAFRGLEMAGEAGEACNKLKKVVRAQYGMVGSVTSLREVTDELADVVICVDLICMDLGINLSSAIIRKFNQTSEKNNLTTRISRKHAKKENEAIIPAEGIGASYLTEKEIHILTLTVWGEARGESFDGKKAVAHVVQNRVAKSKELGGHWWGNSIQEVCLKPQQFSCWNEDDPNYASLIYMRTNSIYDKIDKALYFKCREAVMAVCPRTGIVGDITKKATHYHAKHVLPWWAKKATECTRIGNHIFYKDIG